MLSINNFSARIMESPLGLFEIASTAIISLCALSIFVSIIINFAEAKKDRPKKEKKSVVETGTMLIFFFVFYSLIRFRIGEIDFSDAYARIPLTAIGLLVIVFGTVINIKGRLMLGKNWANQIKIYEDHSFVNKGVYSIVRHPLYASLIWIFYAASVIYFNYAAFLANTFVFVPFMYYRAKQEEELLREQFKNYDSYSKSVGMFFPRIK